MLLTSPVEQIEMSSAWLIGRAKDVCTAEATILFQGAEASGFGRVQAGRLELRLTPDVKTFQPGRYWDIRMFGDQGEYHCWKIGKQWRARLAKPGDPEWGGAVTRKYALWGTDSRESGDWFELWETRGARVHLPKTQLPGLREKRLPVRLTTLLRIEADETSGVVGVVDAMLRFFEVK